MKVTVYVATTINGYIAKEDGNSEWVSPSDYEEFTSTLKNAGVTIMGKNTYLVCKESGDFPFEDTLNIVLTHDPQLLSQTKTDTTLFTDKDIQSLLTDLDQQGYSQAVVIGGSATISEFFKTNVVDEIVLCIHPLLFGKGMLLLNVEDLAQELVLQNVRQAQNGLVKLTYTIKK